MSKQKKSNKPEPEPTFLNRFGIDGDSHNIKNLILLSICTPLLVTSILFLTGKFDVFDLSYYLTHITNWVIYDKIPYTASNPFDYPPLTLIPMLLAVIPALVLNSPMAFVISFIVLMIICNVL